MATKNIKNITSIKNNIKSRIWLTIITMLFTITSCIHNKKSTQKTKSNLHTLLVNHANQKSKLTQIDTCMTTKEQHVITIWIHGTRFIHDHVFADFFYRKKGLHHVNTYKDKHQLSKIATCLSTQNTPRFIHENIYFFGWSGDLSHKKRKLAAKELRHALLDLVQAYKKTHGVIPKIRLITHSHGGNVALCYAKRNDKLADPAQKINISELVLLACPVQCKTAPIIASNTFEKIYSLYSPLDLIQRLDPQGLHEFANKQIKRITKPLFSERRFASQDNLIQSRIKINGRGILHIEFLSSTFVELLPHILQELDIWETECKINNNSKATHKNYQLSIRTKGNKASFSKKHLKKKKALKQT